MTADPLSALGATDRNDATDLLWRGRAPFRVLHGPADLDAAGHAALGPALLRTASRQGTNWLRCYSPPETAAFTGLDRMAPGFGRAWAAALGHGFQPVRRASGGRMAAYHRQCLCLDVVLADGGAPALDPWTGLAALAAELVSVLRAVGIDARAGEVPGEYCPGRFSVNVAGRVKLAGTAARRVPGATLLSAVLVVDDPEPLRCVTTDIYAALPFPFRPETVGGAADHLPGLTVDALVQQLLYSAAGQVELIEGVAVPTHPVSPS